VLSFIFIRRLAIYEIAFHNVKTSKPKHDSSVKIF